MRVAEKPPVGVRKVACLRVWQEDRGARVALPEALIAATRAARGLVVAAFDCDTTGEHLWESMRGRYPDAPDITRALPPTGKDFNDALRAQQQPPRSKRGAQERGH